MDALSLALPHTSHMDENLLRAGRAQAAIGPEDAVGAFLRDDHSML